jgi:hypothetical protein
MKIIIITIAALFVFFVSLLTVNLWGKSQVYTEYKHKVLTSAGAPIIFIKPSFNQLDSVINSTDNIYLDVVTSFDQKLVIPKRKWLTTEKPIRLFNYEDVKNDVILLANIKNQLANKKIIFNINDNAQAGHEIFLFNMQQLGFEKGENYIVTSPYEAPVKALKELAPALIFGTTQPEILKIVAMQSMYLLPALNIRADVVIHPLKIRNQNFYNNDLLLEMKKRYKKIIIGPINESEKENAEKLSAFGIILNRY